MQALPSSLRIDTSCTLVNSKDAVPGALPHRYNVSDIDMEIRRLLTVQVGSHIYTHQLKALPRSLDYIAVGRSFILGGPTGSGKTYYWGGLIREIRRLWPDKYSGLILFVTDTAVCMQTQDVFKNVFGLDNILVCGYPALRATLGTLWIEWKTQVRNGTPQLIPVWETSENTGICAIFGDEMQNLKNSDSEQSTIMRSAANAGYLMALSSATPFSKAAHLRTPALIMRPLIQLRKGGPVIRLDEVQYPAWLNTISDKPEQWHAPDMKRACHALQHHMIQFGPIRYAHLFKIRQIVLPFSCPEHAAIYNKAFAEYQELRIRADRDPLVGFAAVLVALAKFLQKAELLRAEYLAKSAYECVNSRKRPINAIVAVGFKDTLYIVKELLLTKYKVPEDQISMIFGGQSKKERQHNINRFNSEKSRYMLMMLKAGGTGLSLHHTKNKKYPSEMFVPPIWNDTVLVQLMGRPHRINSESTTYLNICWFAGTEEERVAEKVKGKCAALREVVGKNESWADALDASMPVRSTRGQVSAAQLYEKENKEDEDDDIDDNILNALGPDGNANAIVHQLNI